MTHKCFISFKTEDNFYKSYIQNELSVDMIDKSLNYSIDSDDEEYILRKIREEHLADSTVTIFLIGLYSAESLGYQQQKFIKRELQASLYDGKENTKNGILGVVLPIMQNAIFKGDYICSKCSNSHSCVSLNDETVIREFSYNYYIPNNSCSHTEEERYCVLVKWEDFDSSPEKYIDQAFNKRAELIASKTRIYGI